MKVEGEMAANYLAIDLASLASVPGTLVSCDDADGTVVTKDKTGEQKSFNFGPRRIKLIPKPHR